MARRLRLFVTDVPYHVIQRGNNRNPIFFSEEDCSFFLNVLQEAKLKHPCFIYSYCLMVNHFHLLIQPKEKNNISLLMKLLGAKYVHYANRVYKRSGTLWEGRFRCSLIDKEQYFLACLRYIEMNPVRAGLVESPDLYRWSSYRFRALGEKNFILDLDPWYNSLGSNLLERRLAYRRFIKESIPESEWGLIKEMTNKNGIIGSDVFRGEIEKMIGARIVFRSPGRPLKK